MTNRHLSEREAIDRSIKQYKDSVMKNANPKIRLLDETETKYMTFISSWEKATLHFIAPLYQSNWVTFAPNTQLDCGLISSDAIYNTRIRISKWERIDDNLGYISTIMRPIQRIQQRAHYRLDLLSDVQYAALTNGAGRPLISSVKQTGTCVNLSEGGLCMVSKEYLDAYQHVAVYLTLLEHDFVLPGMILENRTKNDNGLYTYRIKFHPMDVKKSNLLAKLIFDKQQLAVRQTNYPFAKKKSK